MSDTVQGFRDLNEYRKMMRAEHGRPCPVCVEKLPRANPTILLPGQRCRIHKYVDPREEIA